MMVSFYKYANDTRTQDARDVLAVLQGIKAGEWDAQVLPVRALYPSDAYTLKKKTNIPGFTTSGVFSERRDTKLTQHSGLLAMDIDRSKNPDLDIAATRARLQADSYVYACFLSLSGDGLAVFYRVPGDNHRGSWRALKAYLLQEYKLHVDDACPNESRLRFVSSDPDLYLNEGAATFEETLEEAPKPATPPRAARPETMGYTRRRDASAILLNIGLRMVERSGDGTKHHQLRNAGRVLGGYVATGFLSYEECFAALYDAIQHKENVADLKNAEEAIRWGLREGQKAPLLPTWMHDYVRQQEKGGAGREAIVLGLSACEGLPPARLEAAVDAVLDAANPTLLTFWKKMPTAKHDGFKLVPDREKLLEWLSEEGFRAMPDAKDVRLLRIINNVVHPIERYAIKHHALNYARALPDFFDDDLSRGQIVELLLSQRRDVFDQELLQLLPPLQGEFLRDTATQHFAFYENCWTETTAAGRTAHPYDELPGLVWAADIKPGPFFVLSDDAAKQCDVYPFTQRITATDIKLSQLQRALGYLIHTYKNITNARCVIFMDAIGEVGKSSGGTGKGLLMQAVGEMVKVCQLDGESFDLRDPFRYEEVTDDARVVFFDEWKATRNPFTALFSALTGGLPINREYQAKKTIPFKDAPKFAIATNEVVTSDDDSSTRRMVEVALTKHYSASFTPIDDFGRPFFGEHWDAQEYNYFYNLALMWVQDYLANGLLLLRDESIAARGLVQNVGQSFHEFAVDLMELKRQAVAEQKDHRIWAGEAYLTYQAATGDKRMSGQSFNKKMESMGLLKKKCYERDSAHRGQRYFLLPEHAALDG